MGLSLSLHDEGSDSERCWYQRVCPDVTILHPGRLLR